MEELLNLEINTSATTVIMSQSKVLNALKHRLKDKLGIEGVTVLGFVKLNSPQRVNELKDYRKPLRLTSCRRSSIQTSRSKSLQQGWPKRLYFHESSHLTMPQTS